MSALEQGAPIGWYAHHHGRGHIDRVAAIAPLLERHPVTVLTSAGGALPAGLGRIELPADLPRPGESAERGPAFAHYAPRGVAGHSERMALISSWIAARRPALFVVDVSCEVAMLAALCGARVCVVRQHGRRVDRPHRLAYEAAAGMIAPWPRWLDDGFEDPWADLTTYTGFPASGEAGAPGEAADRVLTVLIGGGGSSFDPVLGERWARALPDWRIVVLGEMGEAVASAPNLELRGDVADPASHVRASTVAVSHAGNGSIGVVAAAHVPLIVVAEQRPFDEQREKVRRLDAAGVAIGLEAWPEPAELVALLERCRREPPQTGRLAEGGDGAVRAAEALAALAEGAGPSRQSTSSAESSSVPGRRSRRRRSVSGSQSIQPRSRNVASQPSIGQTPQR